MMETYTLSSQAKPVRFTGTLLAEESTDTGQSLRWLELALYRIDQGPRTGEYVLHRVGQSVVYHKPGTCGYGKAVDWKDVPDDAEPCPTCNPPVELGKGLFEVWLESPRHRVIKCPVPSDVEKALLMKRRDGSLFLSTPAANLIESACGKDGRLKEYFNEAEEL